MHLRLQRGLDGLVPLLRERLALPAELAVPGPLVPDLLGLKARSTIIRE